MFYEFPSPCGVCGLKYIEVSYNLDTDEVVSVPLRGLWFEIGRDGACVSLQLEFPSPCGVCGLKSCPGDGYSIRAAQMFPSPCGVCGLKFEKRKADLEASRSFRPLAGFVV